MSLSFALGRGVAQPIDPEIETVQRTLTLPDGRILASTLLNKEHNRARVVRLLPDGRLDPTFAPSYYYGAYYYHGEAPSLALTRDGRVVVWGDLGQEPGRLIARLLADGSVDPTFQELDFVPGRYRRSRVLSLVVTPDDSLVFVLEPGTQSFFGLQLHRIKPTGELDGTFVPPRVFDYATLFACQPDNRVLIWITGDVPGPGALRRLNPNGSIDPTFAVQIPGLSWVNSARLLPDGRIEVEAEYIMEGVKVTSLLILRSNGSVEGDLTPPTRLVNFSARAAVAPGYPPQIGGFVLRNAGARPVLLRGVGRGMPIDLPGFTLLPDPVLTLYRGNEVFGRDVGSALAPAITTAAQRMGAFALRPMFPPNEPTRDSALIPSLAAGSYTLHVGSAEGRSGVSLFEFYDSDPANAAASLVNVSIRGRAAPGTDTLIAGFVIDGPARALRLLIRGIGPGLAPFGVSGVIADPQITLFDQTAPIVSNDNWADHPNLTELIGAAERVGAFPLPRESRDAALLIDLFPGAYAVHGRAADGGAGEMMIELYLVEN
jgi:hypothetical protein